jgi:hypothetical protein
MRRERWRVNAGTSSASAYPAGLRAVARASSDARGLLRLDGVAPDLADLAVEIKVSSPSPEDRVDAMLDAWSAARSTWRC